MDTLSEIALALPEIGPKKAKPTVVPAQTDVWAHILSTLNYEGDKDILIESEQIKSAKESWKGKKSQFEPRLLCKQDSDADRPAIFREHGLCILSVRNGVYLLTKQSIYHHLTFRDIEPIELRRNRSLLLLQIGKSENSLIDNLRHTGLFETEAYLNEPIPSDRLLSGRHRCSFRMRVGEQEIDIKGSQYETDAAYESEHKVLIIECKSGRDTESFNTRQLYYPFRTVYDAVKGRKEIMNLFICQKDETIHIWKIEFTDPHVMTSAREVGYQTYIFRD